ncbi:MAG: hypothetical protein OJF58_000528 [Enhydrobacter sp.]|nr:MAG: hypothetical protein OJF58_000528 [Enhydrobacter sp.]
MNHGFRSPGFDVPLKRRNVSARAEGTSGARNYDRPKTPIELNFIQSGHQGRNHLVT